MVYDLNPHRGGNPLRELAYDARHPVRYWKSCFLSTLRGQNPRVDSLTRFAGVGIMVVGAANFLVGIAMVIRGVTN